MKAAVFAGNEKFEIKEVPRPEPPPGWGLVQVKAAGICGSDVHVIRAENPGQPSAVGKILGHENAGLFVKAGSDTTFREGDRVAIEPLTNCDCGKCAYCLSGQYNNCSQLKHVGMFYPGGFAEYTMAPLERIYLLPEEVDFELGSMLDVVAVGVHAADLGDAWYGDRALVYGDGPVAMATVAVLRAMGINDLTLLGRYEPKLAVARAMGATRTIKAVKNTAGENELTEADWTAGGTASGVFDLAISCVGGAAEPLLDLVPRMAKNGRIIHLGVTHGRQSVALFEVLKKELRIIGSNCYSYRGQHTEAALGLEMMRRRPEVFRRLFTHRVPLERINEGLEMMLYSERDRVVKILVEP